MNLISSSELAHLYHRANSPEFSVAVHRLHREVADYLHKTMTPPDGPAGYYHDYFCPEHGVQLVFDLDDATAHRCPVDGKLWTGGHLDAARRWFVNNRLSEIAIRLALAWRLEGDPQTLAAVTDILDGYAARYADYARVPRQIQHHGVAAYTTLDEAVWVLPLTWAFDLARAGMTVAHQQRIADQLLEPAARHLIHKHFNGIHNFACWHNAAIGTIGLVINRPDLVDFAVQGPFGFEAQLREGTLDDGLWFEGSFSYHFYALYPLLTLAKAIRELRERPKLRAMLHAPILCAYPDASLPATNDCWYFTNLVADVCHGVPQGPAFYEIGYAWYGEPLFAEIVQRALPQSPRDSLDALLFGVDTLPTTRTDALGALPSVTLPASGYAIVRSQMTEVSSQITEVGDRSSPIANPQPLIINHQSLVFSPQSLGFSLLLKYGPHGGGHGHPDKLALSVYAYGQRMSPDLGTPGYGLDLFQTWYRQSISHNTVILDGQSQPEATGSLNQFQVDGPFQVADASVRWDEGAYAGVQMRRVVLARPDYFIDLFFVNSDRERQIDWVYRNAGTVVTRSGAKGLIPDVPSTVTLSGAKGLTQQQRDASPSLSMTDQGDGYQHIADGVGHAATGPMVATWQMDGVGMQVFLAGDVGSQIITGYVPGMPPTEQQGILIQRRTGANTVFVSVFHPYVDKPQVEGVEWHSHNLGVGWLVCTIQIGERQERWLIRRQADVTPPTEVSLPSEASLFEYTLNA